MAIVESFLLLIKMTLLSQISQMMYQAFRWTLELIH